MRENEINGVQLVDIKRIETPGEGFLQFFETSDNRKTFPYDIKRIYYITEVRKGICRGGHAHKTLKQILFCPFGSIIVRLNDGIKTIEIDLDAPNKAIMITKPIWREMIWKIENSVLCVGASDYYDEEDYIRDYNTFLKYIR